MQINGSVQQRQNSGGKKNSHKSETQLSGMKAISEYTQRGESTILKLIKEFNFPASKILGIWESDKLLIDKWRLDLLSNGK
jgi:predicted DNA-binding transcriptional regulator AlpA